MLLENIAIVMVGTRFPENIGMAARACANMGCPSLRLVTPELWIKEKAEPLATAKGLPVLNQIKVFDTLADAVSDTHLVVGTTARTGGWRKGILQLPKATEHIKSAVQQGEKVAIVFGPEDRGLSNAEITVCHELVNIQTENGASSLNVAQAILLVLYASAEVLRKRENKDGAKTASRISAEDMNRLQQIWRQTLLSLDCLHGDNPDYFFLPWQRLLHKAHLTRQEYDALMGLCRQIRYKMESSNAS